MASDEEELALLEDMFLKADDKEVQEKERKEEEKRKKDKFFADSSDEEDKKESTSKYNEFGNGINKILKEAEEARKYRSIRLNEDDDNQPGTSRENVKILAGSSTLSSKTITKPAIPTSLKPTTSRINSPAAEPSRSAQFSTNDTSVCQDPIFGLRIINPVLSSKAFKEMMVGKTPVGVQRVRFHTEKGDVSKDWVIAAVLISKSPVKTTQKGDSFSIWTLSDLRGEIKMCTLFLFKSAHKELWKMSTGTVIAILNPRALERKDDKIEAALSIDNHQRVVIMGQSKDLGMCKAKKNNGDPCGAIVNKTDCDVCVFHMKKEYGNIRRSEFQSAGLGRGLQELRNKVLGKSEVFYAGQSFTAVKAQKPVKQMKKDNERLMKLSEYYSSPYNPNAPTTSSTSSQSSTSSTSVSTPPGFIRRAAPTLDSSTSQRKKDIERLKLLQGTESPQIVLTPKFERANVNTNSPAEPSKKDASFVPKLSSENLTFSFSVSGKSRNDLAKQRAAAILKKKPLETSNPNLVKYRGTDAGKKRIADDLNSSIEGEVDAKKVKVSQEDEAKKRKEYLQKIMNAKSSHDDLVENMQRDKEQKTFDRLEKKEAMEERMANTMEMKCKAVICSKCKYIYFSASDFCKEGKHPLRVVDANKRFYQCGDCKSRTITLFRIPRDPCRNCQSRNWKRTGMIADKMAYVGEQLSIRGDEEMFIGSANNANLNLLVPDSN